MPVKPRLPPTAQAQFSQRCQDERAASVGDTPTTDLGFLVRGRVPPPARACRRPRRRCYGRLRRPHPSARRRPARPCQRSSGPPRHRRCGIPTVCGQCCGRRIRDRLTRVGATEREMHVPDLTMSQIWRTTLDALDCRRHPGPAPRLPLPCPARRPARRHGAHRRPERLHQGHGRDEAAAAGHRDPPRPAGPRRPARRHRRPEPRRAEHRRGPRRRSRGRRSRRGRLGRGGRAGAASRPRSSCPDSGLDGDGRPAARRRELDDLVYGDEDGDGVPLESDSSPGYGMRRPGRTPPSPSSSS